MVSTYRGISDGIRLAQWRLDPDAFLSLFVLLPPVAEQEAIGSFLAEHLAAFDALTAESGRAIDLLHARRAALISAAVTGQIDVRGLVEPGAA